MEEGEKKPDAGMVSGGPQKKVVYAVLAVAVVILAVVLIAKFGYNTDVLNPAGGQMSLVQRPPITIVRPNITLSGPGITVTTPAFQRVTTPIVRPCQGDWTACNGACVYLQTDWNNCGSCGNSCIRISQCKTGNCSCSNGNCVSDSKCVAVVCQDGFSSCCDGRCVRNDVPHTCGGYFGA